MTIKSRYKHLLAVVLLSGVSSLTTVSANDANSTAAEAKPTEAELSFRDLKPLEKAFIDTAPDRRDNALPVGTLSQDKAPAIVKLAEEIAKGKHDLYDSLLIAQNGELLFESYFLRGRIDLPHRQASATKAYTSLILGRAIQLGYLSMADLDKPLIDFLGDLDRSKLVEGADKITLDKALTMHGGLTIDRKKWQEHEKNTDAVKGQLLVQSLLEQSEPITDDTQIYQYGNFNPMLVMTVIDAVVPGTAEAFIKTEFLDRLGINNYSWETHPSGLPQAGWGVNMTSRDMLKLGLLVQNDGQLNGEQFIPADYLNKATSGLVDPTQEWVPEAYRYGYFWYQVPVMVGDQSYDVTFAWGGGDQRVIVVKELDLTVVFTGDSRSEKLMEQVSTVILPAFAS